MSEVIQFPKSERAPPAKATPSDIARFVEVGLSRFARAGDDSLDQIKAAHLVLSSAVYLYASLADGNCAMNAAGDAWERWEAVYPSEGHDAA